MVHSNLCDITGSLSWNMRENKQDYFMLDNKLPFCMCCRIIITQKVSSTVQSAQSLQAFSYVPGESQYLIIAWI